MNEGLTLWIIRASNSDGIKPVRWIHDAFMGVYARDIHHAQKLAQAWIEEQKQRGLPHHFTVSCPEGLLIGNLRVPGVLVPGHTQIV